MAVAQEKPPEEVSASATKKTKQEQLEELSPEDQKLKDELMSCVSKLADGSEEKVMQAIEQIGNEIRNATTSMTSVPKPLKFLGPQYPTVKAAYGAAPQSCNQGLADILSILATVALEAEEREALHFLLKGSSADPSVWGQLYMRHIAKEIAEEYSHRAAQDPVEGVEDILKVVEVIVKHHMEHNAEPEAVDLLLEVDAIADIVAHVDDRNYQRTCLYLTSTSTYLPEPDNVAVAEAAFHAYMKVNQWHDAMRVALGLNRLELAEKVFSTCTDTLHKQQLAYLLATQGVLLDCEIGPCTIEDEELREKMVSIMSNAELSKRYLSVARDLDVMEPKLPEAVYKMHLVDAPRGGLGGANVDSAKANLSTSIVNGLLNVGFCNDKLMSVQSAEGEKHWVTRNRGAGALCAVASLGLINMWDYEEGITSLDKYTHSTDKDIAAGASLGIGLACCGIRTEVEPALALLGDHVGSGEQWQQICAVMGLGVAYAGSRKEDVRDMLLPLLAAEESSMELVAHTALALGLIYAASGDGEIVEALLTWFMSAPEKRLEAPFARFVCLALGFLFLGTQDAVDATVEVVTSMLNPRVSRYANIVLTTCAYAGTGDVLKVQEMLAMAGEEQDDKADAWQKAHLVPCTIGIGLIAMGEPLGSTMATRMLEHVLAYAAPEVRAAVPLALALLHVSRPDMYTIGTLSRLSHDTDTKVAQAALLALGVVGCGTNNARLAGMLRQLSGFYRRDHASLHLVRVAQGLVHMAKGLATLQPFHGDRQLLSRVSLSALLTVLFCGAEPDTTLCGSHAFMLYYLAPAIRPRMLVTIDEEGNSIPIMVRVGEAVDVVAQAGKPRTIAGFQQHDTPVLLATEERAELATEEYVTVSPLLEGVVIVRKNPAYVP